MSRIHGNDVGVRAGGHEELGLGRITLSWSASISHFGVAAGGSTVAGSPSAAAVIGRWTTDAIATCARDGSPAYTEAKSAGLM
jgi:hypothetical protein